MDEEKAPGGAPENSFSIDKYRFLYDYARESPTGRFGFGCPAGLTEEFGLVKHLNCPLLFLGAGDVSFFRLPMKELVARLVDQVEALRNAKEVVLLGTSGGGYVAFNLGAHLAAHLAPTPVRILAFCPVTRIWPPDSERGAKVYVQMIRRSERNPAMRAILEAEGDTSPMIERLRDIPGADLRALVVAGSYHQRDFPQAERMRKLKECKVMLRNTAEHGLQYWMEAPVDDIQFAREQMRARMEARRVEQGIRHKLSDAEVDATVKDIIAMRKDYPTLDSLLNYINS